MTAHVGTVERVRLAGHRQKITLTAQARLLVVLALFGLAVITIGGRLIYYGAFEGQAKRGLTSTDVIPVRADLVDRNGIPLARTIKMRALFVRPDKILGNKVALAAELAQIFPDTPQSTFFKAMTKNRPSYLRRRLVPEDANKVHALGEVGFEFPQEDERFYPQHGLGAHVLGYVDADRHGVMGMEKAMDKRLTDPARLAQPEELSIDIRVQAALESELGATMKKHSALGATGIVLDVRTGEVLAMASLPEFNPNKIDAKALRHQVNDVTYSVYELGSTFKPLTIAAALDAGTVTNLATRYDATEPLKVGGFRISDDHPQHRFLNVPETLVHSSNIVTARIADNLGQKRMEALFRSLEFDERPDIELVERGRPLWPQSWGRITNMTVAYGHGIAVTPLHLASAYAALVNGGIWRPATLEKVNPNKVNAGRRVFKASTSARMRQLLRMIVSDGTGRKADAPGFRIGGKTGSAEKPSGGGYSQSNLVSTFAAAFPMDDPKYVVIAMLDEPKGIPETGGQRTAGWTAAPVIRRLVPRIGPMLGVVPDESRDVDVSELTPLLWSPKVASR